MQTFPATVFAHLMKLSAIQDIFVPVLGREPMLMRVDKSS